MLRKVILALLILLILIQFVPIEQTNPEGKGEIAVNDSISTILNKSCYDCHSNETKWPWYTTVAPISWRIIDHIEEGRRELNFSDWLSYSLKRKLRKLNEVVEEVEKGEMPLKEYVLLHPGSDLSEEEKTTLITWAKMEIDSLKKVENDTIK